MAHVFTWQRQLRVVRHARRKQFNPVAKSHEHRRDAVSTGQGYQKFRTLAASGENGPPLLPSKFRRVLQVGI